MATLSSATSPQESYTLQQFIDLRDSDNITYAQYSIFERSLENSELVYSIDNIIYTYMDELKDAMKVVTVTLDQKIKYAYKPKLLSFDVYGSVECYFVLLALNGKCNLKEFDLEEQWFYALKPVDMNRLMSEIYTAESEHLTLNRTTLGIYES